MCGEIMIHECEGEFETDSEYAGGGSRGEASGFRRNCKINVESSLSLKTFQDKIHSVIFDNYLHGYLVIGRRGLVLVELHGAVARRPVQVIFGQRDRNDVHRRMIHGSSLTLQALYALLTGPLEHFTEASTADCQKSKGYDRCEDPETTTTA